MTENRNPAMEFDIKAIKKFYTDERLWPTFPTSTLQVAAPSAKGSTKGESQIEVDAIPVPLLVWQEQRSILAKRSCSGGEPDERAVSLPSLQQRTFEHFHKERYMVGPGDVYGGDYVLYKGENPAVSHSVATVLIHDSTQIPVKDILALGRVNNQVAKSAIIAFDNPEKNDGAPNEDYLVFNFKRVSARV